MKKTTKMLSLTLLGLAFAVPVWGSKKATDWKKEFEKTHKALEEAKKEKEKKYEELKKKYKSMEMQMQEEAEALAQIFKHAAEKKWNQVHFDITKAMDPIPVNSKGSNGRTLLHVAAEQDNLQEVKWLIDHGANPTLEDKNNATAADVTSDLDIMDYIEKAQEQWKTKKK